jgi:phosphoribosyl-AMP cyclohydrolase / phosphoribosyl-ATP pyrophosphohydrolase
MIVPTYDERGLVPCVVQDATSGAVLMLAWMNAEALQLTHDTGIVHFWSRSRQALWKKGETSGNTLALVELRIDCDGDTVLARVTPAGPACHTGATSCFFTRDDGSTDAGPLPILPRLQQVLEARRDSATGDKSYTRSLLDAGMMKILEKLAEEHVELVAELLAGDDTKVIHETADLLFHVMVGLVARGLSIDAVLAELARRFGTSGHTEKASRKQ